ncbi:LTE1 GDP GTP exchange factor [Fusarium heterosporum]|uniref:LTE1 GDP GTP exchange factor n=1 Tax=Fusarium heterosporum TaxID=42747 RepID=A0A8H5TA70_FUSHE|nr:LTE1 GDP GTP exchange factor [Fusarium heterosporum]
MPWLASPGLSFSIALSTFSSELSRRQATRLRAAVPMEALEPSSVDPLTPASGLSAMHPVPSPLPVATTIKDPTSTKTKDQLRSRSGSGVVAAPTAIVAALRKKENTSPSISAPSKWPSVRSTTTARMHTSTTVAKPLVPLSERRIHQKKTTTRSLKDSDSNADNQGSLARWEIAPDGGSAGREGRQFAVANVGNNGRIYLRPTVRPAYQRCPQPQFVFPITPPSTAGLDTISHIKQSQDETSELHISQWTPTPEPSPYHGKTYFDRGPQYPLRPVKHRRALSDSTVHEVTVAKDSEPGAFKIVISKPLEEYRPRTMEDFDSNSDPLLDIAIPSWRIGVPRFTGRGTPMIRGSSYAPTEEFRSSSASLLSRSQGVLNSSHPDIASTRRPSSMAVPMLRISRNFSALTQTHTNTNVSRTVRPSYHSNSKVEPAMFDDLTFKPACDDRTLVKYSAVTGAVIAATPSRLVAEITSPSFLDYELISDFFLTFRAFLETVNLLRMLIARLRWALARDDETGMVVRVRTFVALRHWILNYFMDDFVVDYNLRSTFCELLNDFVDELSQCKRARKVQLKILGELKKCWRRVCALYWDGPDFDDTLDSSVPIAPGGIVGHRDPSLDPSFWEQEDGGTPRIESLLPLRRSLADRTSFIADISRAGHAGDAISAEHRPYTPEGQFTRDPLEGEQTSPVSVTSMDIVSCSFPTKIKPAQPHQTNPLAAHPVTATSTNIGPVATTPRALVGKRVRPSAAHKRNNSLTDSLRDHSSDKLSFNDQEFMMSAPYAGSLVRGNLLPPGQAFVDIEPDEFSSILGPSTSLHPESQAIAKERTPAGAMSGHGMKKLLGSVRRALSTRGQGVSSNQGSYININNMGPRGATTNRIPGTAIVPQSRNKPTDSRPPPVRIDLLGAEVVEDFKKAVRDEAAAEADRRGLPPPMSPNPSLTPTGDFHYSAAHMDSVTYDEMAHGYRMRPVSDMAITTGSKSIVIVDDTTPFDPSLLHRVPNSNASVEAFADTFKLTGGDPTPPSTPPAGNSSGTPRRSSYLLNQHVVRPSLDEDPLPPFVPDFATLAPVTSSPGSDENNRGSYYTAARSMRQHPPVSYQNHRRKRSNRTHRSLNSILHRRSSLSNGLARRSTVQSFDATTVSAASIAEPELEEPMPQPLRMLRRRPGGDLRAATNVGELDPVTLRKSQSVGSLTTYSESIRSSFIQSPRVASFGRGSFGKGEVVSIDYVQPKSSTFSVGQLAEKPKRDLSLFSTHSSKPVMRPSFEKEAQKLAQIPDDEDDGGIESALAKLEGKLPERKSNISAVSPRALNYTTGDIMIVPAQPEAEQENSHDRQIMVRETFMFDAEDSDAEPLSESRDQHLTPQRPATEARSFLTGSSRESYSSVPILDRDSVKGRPWTNMSVLEGPDEENTPRPQKSLLHIDDEVDSQHTSYEFIEKTQSIDGIKSGDTAPSVAEDQSFLNDDSDLSSEMSVDGLDDEESEFGDAILPRVKLPAHPLGSPAPPPKRNPPSPPMTLVQALEMSPPHFVQVPELLEDQVWGQKPLPPSPETTPTPPYAQADGQTSKDALRQAPKAESIESNKYSAHLPFILAFDSEILAQQFTLIEKDALNEIDWKELIDMNWKNAAHSDSRSWVDFLRNSEAHGVEVVIARFNIMVKWAVSEIVLTQGLEERVRCITKFIHIATHCRRYRNFATLGQLTIALSSNEVARLSRTWQHVAPQDVKTLHDLEKLVTPMRNFYNLRAEMEVGSDQGCIPFVGIYTHDLLYNAQRPSEMAGSPTTPPLINFERCRIAAAVVKTLLRLLEASTRYKFQPIEGITERCLWMSALNDEDIRRHSEMLEQ